MGKYIIRKDVGTVYWMDGDTLMFASLSLSGSFDPEGDGGMVDEDLMKDEPVEGTDLTYGDIYEEVKRALMTPESRFKRELITCVNYLHDLAMGNDVSYIHPSINKAREEVLTFINERI